MTARQFYILLWVMVVSLKVQRLPSLIYDSLGRHGYLILFLYLAVNVLGILLAFFILNRSGQKSLSENKGSFFATAGQKVLMIAITIYFLSQGLLLYETIQNLFEHILFDNLSWMVFSVFLIVTIFFLAHTGIKNIALNFELYFYVIIASYVIIAIFGATKADFSVVLPFETIDFKAISSKFINYNLWFGDFFLVLFAGKHAKDIKLKWTLLVYFFAIAFLVLLYVELNGIYGAYTSMKPSLITTITEQSMLGINIGRVDWFLILFTEFGTILSCGVCIYFAKKCLSFVFPKISSIYILMIIMVALYSLNVFYLVDTHMREVVVAGYLNYISAITKWVSFLIMVLFSLTIRKSKKIKKIGGQAHEREV